MIGLSGGIDSALVAALAADALGAEQVEAVSMPTRYNATETRSDAASSSPSGSASRSASCRSRICGSRSTRALPGHERAWPPRTCRRASAACC